MALLKQQSPDICLLDLRLGRESGLTLLPEVRKLVPTMGIIVMTAYAAVETAVEALRAGAFDYLPKPFKPDQLRLLFDRWQHERSLQAEVREYRRTLAGDGEIASDEPAMQSVMAMAAQVAPAEVAVLLRGESGTGKGVLARWLHRHSSRSEKPFVTVHCPSLSRELLESELFGHARGAFTGAVEATEGKVAAAEGGTLFLDEIGDLPLTLQPKLLRFLQDKTYERVGETRTRTGNVRIVAATNRNLEDDVASGQFREDLLYRLNVIELTLPSLRSRRRDLLSIAENLLQSFVKSSGKAISGFSPDAKQVIARHTWPGNIRELRNAIERGVILCTGTLVEVSHLPILQPKNKANRMEIGGPVTIEELEGEHIRRILQQSPSLEEAAAILGIDGSTLYRKRRKLGL